LNFSASLARPVPQGWGVALADWHRLRTGKWITPPPLFKQGTSAVARLVIFVTIALALLIVDARFDAMRNCARWPPPC
jgi:hypothetical protein